MSKRKRRNSRRRKSSFSLKQNISSNVSFQNNIKTPLDYMIKEDHTTEKGETDSFYKEVFSSDEEEKETEISSKEKEKANITVQVDKDKKLKITHSLTLSDLGEKASIVIEITASKVKYESSDVRVEISEMVQSEKSDTKTTSIQQNDKEMEKEKENENQNHQTSNKEGVIKYSWNQCTKTFEQNSKLFENVGFEVMTEPKTNKDSARKPSGQENTECRKSCCKEHFCLPQPGEDPHTDFTLVDGKSTCSSPHGIWLTRRRLSQADSDCEETITDVTSPSRSADMKNDMLQDLTESIVSCHINDSNVLKKWEASQNDPEGLLSKDQFLISKADTQPYELDSQTTLLLNHNQKEDIQMHNNSHSSIYADVFKKRRRTYPEVVYHSDHNVESKSLCRASFSSGTLSLFFMQSLFCQAERTARYHLPAEKEGSSQPSSSSCHGAHTIIPNIRSLISTKTLFYSSVCDKTLKDVHPKCQHEQLEAAEIGDQICVGKADWESISADPLEQSEVAESGFDEEMEAENPVVLTDDDSKNLLIQVTTPSVWSSEERTTNKLHKKVQAYESQMQSSIATVKGGYEQKTLHSNSVSEQNHQSVKGPNSASPKEALEVQKQNPDVSEHKQLSHITARRTSLQSARTCNQTEKRLKKTASAKVKEHLKPRDSILEETSERWAKKRKLFRESRHWGSAEESSTSNITDESDTLNSEDTRSIDMSLQDIEERGFYTETFHSASWIYRGDDAHPNETMQCLSNRSRPVAVRERTVKISKGMGEYPWGFRIQYSKPIIVTEVDTNGAAEEAGLKVGDYVLAVNGTDVTGVPHSEAVDLARQGPDLLILTIGSDIGRTPNTPKPVCRGYLHKRTQSSFLKGWRKRWFVLRHDCCLYYYRNKRVRLI
ncbi:PDZ and LIM domain protein 2 [Bagarius yarrelli]|uniref:PDZ and LIM domain protein 2 n=1 Tax=Bagarius yarrelli TaxID=175774 RepID=A0A556V2B8_BAGYA|nr:PDZ and LIM domain protein 2 [Bagarius yarrelli]